MATPDYLPDADAVGALLRARTKRAGTGEELGTFTHETRPTASQVEELIRQAGADLELRLSGIALCSEDLIEEARVVTALGAALAVELSYFPEQVASENSPYAALERRYEDKQGAFVAAVAQRCAGGADVVGGVITPTSSDQLPLFSYPDDVGMMEGRLATGYYHRD